MQANSNCVINCIGDGWNRGRQRSLATFLCPKWAFWIDALDDNGLDLRRLDRRRAAIFEQPGIHEHPVFPDHLFLERLPEAHPNRSDNLPFDRNRIQRSPAIMRGPYFVDDYFAGIFVHADFGYLSGI